MEFFEHKSVNALIAGSMGLIATALGYYGNCLSAFVIASVMAITGVLITYILMGFIMEDLKKASWMGWIVTIIIFYFAFTRFRECRIPFLEFSWPMIFAALAIGGLIAWILLDKNKPKKVKDYPASSRAPRAPRRP